MNHNKLKYESEFYKTLNRISKPCKECKKIMSQKNRKRPKPFEYNNNLIKYINTEIKKNNSNNFIKLFNLDVSELIDIIDSKISHINEYSWDNFGTKWEINIITLEGCVYDKKGYLIRCDKNNIFPCDISLNEYIKKNHLNFIFA